MKKRDWAREKVDRYLNRFGYFHGLIPSDAAELLQLERARARRIVREIRRKFHGSTMADWACDEILQRLQ